MKKVYPGISNGGKRFRGGVRPPESKDTSTFAISRLNSPEKVYIHLLGSAGAPSKAVVSSGEKVFKGQVIAEPVGRISSFIHSPISGTVQDIKNWPHVSGKRLPAIIIANDFKDEEKPRKNLKNVQQISPSELVEIVRKSGIVGCGGAAFPTDIKLTSSSGKKIETLIINGCECEPFLTADERIIFEKPGDIIEGAKLAARALAAKNIIIALEENKGRSAEKLLRQQDSRIRCVFLPTRYPQGGEKQLIFAVTGRIVPAGGLPADAGCVVLNVQTACALYDALFNGKVLYERVVTLGGLFRKPGNLVIASGTRLTDIIEFRGGIPDEVDKVIMGGPMMGVAVDNLDVPASKATSGILLMKAADAPDYECIRCLRCASVCPMNLVPRQSYFLYMKGRAYEDAVHCMECGACGYSCPSGIPLVQYLKWSKEKLKNVSSAAGR